MHPTGEKIQRTLFKVLSHFVHCACDREAREAAALLTYAIFELERFIRHDETLEDRLVRWYLVNGESEGSNIHRLRLKLYKTAVEELSGQAKAAKHLQMKRSTLAMFLKREEERSEKEDA